jgi:hypothetical protein
VSSRWERLGRYFPLPLVSVAVLLVVLIFITPNLTSPAGSLPTQAQLLVDRVVGANQTNFYLRALGNTRYVQVNISQATNVIWPPVTPQVPPLNFSNQTSVANTLGVSVSTSANPVAVNVTALYRDTSGSCVEYFGTYVFWTAYATQTLEYAQIAPPTTTGTQSVGVGSLPLAILLSSVSVGAC